MKKILLISFMLLSALINESWAQERTVKGKITSAEDGSGLPGVSILVKGTTKGAITDIDGNYSISVSEGAILSVTYVGHASQEVEVGSRSVIDIVMELDSKQLTEVVVTAIGIEKEKKSLGYAVGVVDQEDLTRAKDVNLVNSLAGKVAGVQITNSGGSIGGSSRILVRGQASIGVGVNNQPLFVVDGVPIYNTNFAAGTGDGTEGSSRITGNIDTGNAAMDINPDDIESISVLKGGAAAALYGQRAKDGVVIITTKKGNKYKGAQISVSSTVRFDNAAVLPDFQNEYAQGDFGKYLLDSRGRPQNANGWGPRINGQQVADLAGNTVALTAQPDNVKDFYETGVTVINSISFQDATEKDDFRLSLSNTNQSGIVPLSDLERYTVGLNTGRQVRDWMNARLSINYINSRMNGMAVQGSNDVNVLSPIINLMPRTTNLETLKVYQDPNTLEHIPLNEATNNPYWVLNRNTTGLKTNRVFGNVELGFNILKGLKFTARQGVDYLNYDLERVNYPGTVGITTNGSIRVEQRQQTQLNTDLYFSYSKEFSDFTLGVVAGYNLNQLETKRLRNLASDLQVDNVLTFGNANTNALTRRYTLRRLFGVYSEVTLGYQDFAFLNLRARNDWTSTLPKNNNSFFYPSADLSFVLTDALEIESPILSYAKLRAGWAQVGSDELPYQLDFRAFPISSFFGQLGTSNQFPFGGRSGFEVTGTIPPTGLKPQNQETIEFGAELSFLNDRIGLDFNYYDAKTSDQIISLLIPATTGFRRLRTNAGVIQNKGFEVLLTGTPLLINGFKWDIAANFTRNINRVVELTEGLEELRLESGFNDGVLKARPGEGIKFFGNGYEKDDNGNYVINANTGLREESTNVDLGEVAPEWTMGITNSFSYKNVLLSFLVDIRKGGLIVSNSVGALRRNGLSAETAYNREGTFIDQGVIVETRDADGNITASRPNDVPVASMQEFWQIAFGSRNAEAVTFDAGFVKLREIRLGYKLPESIIGGTPFKSASISIEGRNLWLIKTNIPDVDPEMHTTGAGSNFAGYEYGGVPTTRTVGFNVRLGF